VFLGYIVLYYLKSYSMVYYFKHLLTELVFELVGGFDTAHAAAR